jgi:hypothetical protein
MAFGVEAVHSKFRGSFVSNLRSRFLKVSLATFIQLAVQGALADPTQPEPAANGWKQSELTEHFMRSLTRPQCMTKTVQSLKSGCSSTQCMQTIGGITGDCLTWARGDLGLFCGSYDREYIGRYCDTHDLDSQKCTVLRVMKDVVCKPQPAQ